MHALEEGIILSENPRQKPIERFEATLRDKAYSAHRHDTYAIGLTLNGVQVFDYRGTTRHSLPGEMVVLHPDELHDGRPGTDDGFRYRTLYVRPTDLQDVLGGRPLPFIQGGVSTDERLRRVLLPMLDELETSFETLESEDALYDLATVLNLLSDGPQSNRTINYGAASTAQDYLNENIDSMISLDQLATIAGYDRWQLSRDFRILFGTSPHRYQTLRRLEAARKLIRNGTPISNAAYASGFADQSHFGRHFRKTYGLSPKAWLLSIGAAHEKTPLC